MKMVPFFSRGGFRRAMQFALEEVISWVGAGRHSHTREGWKFFFLLPRESVPFPDSGRRSLCTNDIRGGVKVMDGLSGPRSWPWWVNSARDSAGFHRCSSWRPEHSERTQEPRVVGSGPPEHFFRQLRAMVPDWRFEFLEKSECQTRCCARPFRHDSSLKESLAPSCRPHRHCASAVALQTMRMGRLTALKKLDGGVRGIVVSDVLRRLVARTIAK